MRLGAHVLAREMISRHVTSRRTRPVLTFGHAVQMMVNPGVTYVSSKSDALLLKKLKEGLGPDPAADAFDVRLEKASLFNPNNVCAFGTARVWATWQAQHLPTAAMRAPLCQSRVGVGLMTTF